MNAMILEQTVEIPANRRLHLDFDLPFSLPAGKAKVEVTVIPDGQQSSTPHADRLLGMLAGAGNITREQIREERLSQRLK